MLDCYKNHLQDTAITQSGRIIMTLMNPDKVYFVKPLLINIVKNKELWFLLFVYCQQTNTGIHSDEDGKKLYFLNTPVPKLSLTKLLKILKAGI